MPEWIEQATEPACYIFRDTRKIADAVTALRASRDHWRERAEKTEKDREYYEDQYWDEHDRADKLAARTRDLEAAQARQLATITELQTTLAKETRRADCWKQIATERRDRLKEAGLWKPNPPEKPESSHVCDYRCQGENGHHAWPSPTPPPEAKP